MVSVSMGFFIAEALVIVIGVLVHRLSDEESSAKNNGMWAAVGGIVVMVLHGLFLLLSSSDDPVGLLTLGLLASS